VAAATVFVDDAIRGDLPPICAKTGELAELQVQMQRPVGGRIPGFVWFLLFLGPPGLIALILIAVFAPGAEYLTVLVPRTRASFDHERRLGMWKLAFLGAAVAVPFLGVLGVGMFPGLWLLAGLACLVAAGALTWVLWRQSIGVRIDVSRRWVTLSNVHPAFAAAVDRRESLAARR
jgi:hypothetical protein